MEATTVVDMNAPVTGDERQVIDIITRLYPNEDAFYYLRVLKKLPLTFEEPKVTWSHMHRFHVASNRRNSAKWKSLGEELSSQNLIESRDFKTKRNFN